jgi:hypothetical protein
MERMVVIDESLVIKALRKMAQEDDAPSGGANAAVVKNLFLEDGDENIEFNEVESLRLSFESICKIDNLENFTKLRMLSLDNNCLDRICGLDPLVHLEWLDLSFNQISAIEGLDALTKLTDLSLFNNRIRTIEGLDSCLALNVLSIGNNRLEKLDNLKYLRRFPDLKVVNVAGNPVCADAEYRPFLLAYLKRLKYLDYALVEEREVVSAKEQFQDFLLELEEKESLESQSGEMQRAQHEALAEARAANLERVDGLLGDMLKDDTEVEKLRLMPFYDDMFDAHEAAVAQAADDFKTKALALHAAMQREMQQFTVALEAAREHSTQKAISEVKRFEARRKKVYGEVRRGEPASAGGAVAETLEALRADCERLGRRLMTLEADCVEDFDDLVTTFDKRYDEKKAATIALYGEFFRAVEDLEGVFNEDLTERTLDLVDKFAKEELEAEGPSLGEEVKILLQDKETLVTALATSYDIHIGKLLANEDWMREQFVKRCGGTLTKIRAEEVERSRARVEEVRTLCDGAEQDIEALKRQMIDGDEHES